MRSRFSFVPLLTLAACSTGAAPTVAPATQECAGERVVSVYNDFNQPVDIHAQAAGSAYDVVLGVVQPGTKVDFVLLAGTRGVYALPSGPGRPSTVSPDLKQLVRFRYFCR